MKVCLLSSSDDRGGAYAAAYRLHKGLLQESVDSTLLVGNKTTDDLTVVSGISRCEKGWALIVSTLDAIPLAFYKQRNVSKFSLQWLPDRVPQNIAPIDPSIIHLHWICGGFLRIETLAKFRRPIVWTLHDMWPFTGGCHYSGGCTRYVDSCGLCPQLHSAGNWDMSRCIWNRKSKSWKNLNLTIVTPSRWLANCAKSSSLFCNRRIEVIPNGIDVSRFRPINKLQARDLLSLPPDKRLISFGALSAAGDPRKGLHFLLPALQSLKQEGNNHDIELVIFGASKPLKPLQVDFKIHYLGVLNDDLVLSLLFSASDVFVAPSQEDNLPNTVMESLSCGTPCVAFNIGGMPDMIDHKSNGYLADPGDVLDLARGIKWILDDQHKWHELSANARRKVESEFAIETISKINRNLYESLL